MNKQAAINLMNRSPQIKMTHVNFSPDEYIYMKDGDIYDENNYKMKHYGPDQEWITFWTDRTGPEWNEGWSIYKELPFGNAEIVLDYESISNPTNRRVFSEKKTSAIYYSKNSHKKTNK